MLPQKRASRTGDEKCPLIRGTAGGWAEFNVIKNGKSLFNETRVTFLQENAMRIFSFRVSQCFYFHAPPPRPVLIAGAGRQKSGSIQHLPHPDCRLLVGACVLGIRLGFKQRSLHARSECGKHRPESAGFPGPWAVGEVGEPWLRCVRVRCGARLHADVSLEEEEEEEGLPSRRRIRAHPGPTRCIPRASQARRCRRRASPLRAPDSAGV